MAIASESQGTQTATISTEHSLATPTTNATRVLSVDMTNMAAGDTLELRIKAKVLTGGAIGLVYLATYQHAQNEPVVYSVPIPSLFGATFTLKQTAGTGRNFDWAVLTL